MEIVKNNSQHDKQSLKGIYKFFCWCSGARLYILKECPSDFNKYFGIGTIVFLTGLLASISGGYALFTIFNNYAISIAFGIIWGILIFALDWYIISSLKKENKPIKEITSSLPRIILAVLLAVVISLPLKLKLFEKEINAELVTLISDRTINYTNQVFKEFDELSMLEEKNIQLNNEIGVKQKQRDQLFNMIIEEAEGRSPTGIVGKGPVYEEKKKQLDKIDEELNELKASNQKQIEENNILIAQLRKERINQVNSGKNVNREYDGLLARMEALSSISLRNNTVHIANIFLLILFICIESAPILVKLMSKRGPYDELFDLEEYKKTIEAKKEITQIKLSNNNLINIASDTQKMKTDANQHINKILIDRIKETQTKLNDLRIQKWEEEQRKIISEDNNDIKQEVKKITDLE
ncbi:MAG: DUF4407 domain-containing protein [Bacteroidales bacterium]|nr:DUF4407 domain-containing protein [Bacteroidales bacterium]